MKLKFNITYFLLAVLLLVTEVLIGAYLHDALIRPYGGDYLVVILIYCAFRSFVAAPVLPAAAGSLCFAYLVEISQYFHLVDHIGLGNNKVARMLLGTSFVWTDMLAYTLGIFTVVLTEYAVRRLRTREN